jgi:stage III sporulation protein AF
MIQWLSEWLKEIILVILLATFVDLLLPNSSMQRYVKVVVSLFILLTILSPLITLLKVDFNEDIFRSSIERPNETNIRMEPLEQIMQKGGQLQADNQKLEMQLVTAKIEEIVQAQVEKEIGEKAKEVFVQMHTGQNEPPRIASLRVVLHVGDEAEKNNRGSVKLMEPIRPVHISVNIGDSFSKSSEPQDEGSSLEESDLTRTMHEKREKVYQMLKRDIPADEIEVLYEKGR